MLSVLQTGAATTGLHMVRNRWALAQATVYLLVTWGDVVDSGETLFEICAVASTVFGLQGTHLEMLPFGTAHTHRI